MAGLFTIMEIKKLKICSPGTHMSGPVLGAERDGVQQESTHIYCTNRDNSTYLNIKPDGDEQTFCSSSLKINVLQ